MAREIDFRLVGGFNFRCIPGCGLCCYTTPAVAPFEKARLIRLDPHAPLVEGTDGWVNIASRPEGGACHFLQEERCECHTIRPGTCAQFPLVAFAGARVQVSVVFTCPGVDLAPLLRWDSGVCVAATSSGLAAEMEAVRADISRADQSGQLQAAEARRSQVERRLRRKAKWQSEEEVRRLVQGNIPALIPSELHGEGLLDEANELEQLPMFYDPSLGRVVWRRHPAGVEFLALREMGGIAAHLDVQALPRRPPPLEARARALLHGYLNYLLERDITVGVAYNRLLEGADGQPDQLVERDLRSIAGQVLLMATLRRAGVSGERGDLTELDVANGIRATDLDILDRPTIGLRV